MKNRYRIKITLERVGPGTRDHIGERWVELHEQVTDALRALPDDREIMEMMSDKHPVAHEEYIKNERMIAERRDAVDLATRAIRNEVLFLIESQDKVNGYKQSEVSE